MNTSYIKKSFEENLDIQSIQIREILLDKFYISGKGHLGSAFSLIELLRVLFSKFIKFDNLTNNRLIISQGWASLVYYYFLSEAKQIDQKELDTTNKLAWRQRCFTSCKWLLDEKFRLTYHKSHYIYTRHSNCYQLCRC